MFEPARGKLLGRCRLEEPIGQGAMGVVWEAHHETLDIRVAVKVLRGNELVSDHSRHRERFQREARMAARINHPGLVRVLDFGEEEGHPYLVMELVRGQTLEQYLRRKGELPERLALQVVGHLCTALAVAHAADIVHRDLKPANILLDAEGRLKISDLGLARDTATPAITGSTGIVGTPHYIAPECLENGAEPDARADLYAVGIMLYLMLFGRHPWEGTTAQILNGHARGTPDFSGAPERHIGSGTLQLLRKLLEKKPLRRYGSATEVVQACRQQVARLEGNKPVKPSEPISRDGIDSSEFRLRRMLEGQFATSTSLHDGARILHTTWKERLMIWGLLLGLVGIGLASWLMSR